MLQGVITNATDWRSHALQGRCKFQGLPLSIENERGSYRQGVDEHGKTWRTFMHIAYGYIRLTEGTDGDHVDVYIGQSVFSDRVFVVHQVDPVTKKYDEDKVMLGFNTPVEAKVAYQRQYDRPDYFGTMDEYDMATFKQMLKDRKGMKLKKSLESLEKAKRMPIGTISHGRKKIAEGRWVPIKQPKGKIQSWTEEHYLKLAVKYPNKLDEIIERVRGARGSLVLGRDLGESVETFFKRDKKIGQRVKDLETTLKKLETIKTESRWPEPMPEFRVKQNLGGTTGGVFLIEMANGERKVMKQSTSPKHLLDEYTANRVYKILGVPVPNVSLHGTDKGIAQVHDYIEGTPLGDLDPEARQQAIESLKRGFVADALLGNWDVLGLDEDNILWDGSKAWRIDNGGALRYRAQGTAKGDMFGGTVGEIETMRDRDRQAGRIFGEVSENEIADQVRNVMAHRQTILQAIEDPRLRATMEARIGSLEGYLEPVIKAKKMPIGTISRGRKKVAEGKWIDVKKPKSGKQDAIEQYKTEFKERMSKLVHRALLPGEEKKLNDVAEKQGKRLEKLMGSIGRTVSFEGTGIMSGLGTMFKLLKVDIPSMTITVSKGKKTYTKRMDDLVYGKEKFEIKKALDWIPESTLLKSSDGIWYLYENNKFTRFWWFHDLEKAIKTKTYYSPEEVKARGMRWVTIRGARVLVQGTADGGWVVVGGAGGKLNHLRIDKILSKEEYEGRRKKVEQKRKEELRALSKEELAEQTARRREEVKAKRAVREQYTAKVTEVLGITQEEIRSEVTTKQMDELAEKARIMVEGRASTETMDAKAIDKEINKQTDKEIEKAIQRRAKDVERQALETLMHDYMPDDPNAKPELKKLLDPAKALEVLAARKAFRKEMKKIGKGAADIPTNLKVGDIFAAVSAEDYPTIEQEVRDQIETQKNIRLYDALNAQSLTIQKHVDEGVISALNGLIGDIYRVGATFSADTVEQLGLEAIVRAVTIKLQWDGKGDVVRKALEEYAATEREKVVTEALKESEKRFKNAESLRSLARNTDDAEAILSMASANGHALKQLTAGQRALGTAVGSLRAVAHMINALTEPLADVVQIDIGKDLARARKKAKKSGLPKGSYSIKTVKAGKGKRLVLEIKKDQLNTFFERNSNMRQEESEVDKIKMHKANDGYIPPGIKKSIKLDPAQEAGLRFFKEQDKVILDFQAGLGKTAIGYAAAMEAIHNKGAKKVLIVTPAKLRGQMFDERKTFLDDENQKIVRQANENVSKAERLKRYEKEGIMIVGHDQLRTDAAAIKAAGFGMIIVDEIHELTAGAGKAGRYKGMMELKDIPLKIGMSGTNIKNKKNELYRKINFVDPDHTLGTMAEFEKRYKGLNQGTGMFSDAANDAFRKEIAQWMYTQKNALPIKNKLVVERLPLSSKQRSAYAASERIYRDERAKKVLGASVRRDVRNYEIITDRDDVNNVKLDRLVNVMKESHSGEKAVIHVSRPGVPVLAAMKTAVRRLKTEFGDDSIGMIHGESPPGEVRELKRRFNDPDDPLKFIIGTKSLESGHNLQGGGTVTFHLDLSDSYAGFEQRNARIDRKGQDRDTTTYVLSGMNPYDMRGEDILETKRKEQSILGNPREIESMDDTGFLGMLNKYEAEAQGAKA